MDLLFYICIFIIKNMMTKLQRFFMWLFKELRETSKNAPKETSW